MATALEKFKAQYPAGALTADLVSFHDGKFIVKATVAQNGEVLASGLAASVDVQIAEDNARNRALAVLGIKAESNDTILAPEFSKPSRQTAASPTANSSTDAQVTTTSTSSKKSVNSLSSTGLLQSESASLIEVNVSEPAEEDLGPPIETVAEEPVASAAQTSAAAIALENFSSDLQPVDLSDVIAQTDIELKRLGWTSEQGRAYLMKTYGKRSRQQLTDEELMSFLLHLEEQT